MSDLFICDCTADEPLCQASLLRSHHCSFSTKIEVLDSVKLTFRLNAISLNACQMLAVSGYLPCSYSAHRGYLSSKHNAIYHHSVVYASTAPITLYMVFWLFTLMDVKIQDYLFWLGLAMGVVAPKV